MKRKRKRIKRRRREKEWKEEIKREEEKKEKIGMIKRNRMNNKRKNYDNDAFISIYYIYLKEEEKKWEEVILYIMIV